MKLKGGEVIIATQDIYFVRDGCPKQLMARKGERMCVHFGLGGVGNPPEVNVISRPYLSFDVEEDQWELEQSQ